MAAGLVAGASAAAPPSAPVEGSGGTGAGVRIGANDQQYDPTLEYHLGRSDLESRDYRGAVVAFTHVVQIEPRSADAWLLLGLSKSGVGDAKGAMAAYRASVRIDGHSVRARRELALLLIRLNQTAQASEQLAALKGMAARCADACPDADQLGAAIDVIETALSLPSAPQGGALPKPAA
jgi:tetratricopeptide (TPR) repeat protein